jgi:cyclic di-GMP phosphodiesterase
MTADVAPTILVVDDDETDRKLLATALEREGYGAATASQAAEARRLLSANPFPLVVCDLHMPGGSGLSLVAHIRQEHPDTAILIVSGDCDRETADGLSALGAYGYLIKPFGIEQFLITVANALRRHELEESRTVYERALEHAVTVRTAELRHSRMETVRRLAVAVESRDGATGLHSERTGRYSWLIATELGLDAETCELISVAMPLHDIGKIAIPDRILHKRGPLSPDELATMQTHTTIGHSILAGGGEELLELAATIAWTHHERLDGSGYPRGLTGELIPVAGRIAAVADTLDALTSDRPYRAALPLEWAVEIVVGLRGTKLDRAMVDALIGSLEDGEVAPEPASQPAAPAAIA